MKKIFLLTIIAVSGLYSPAQTITTPQEFLGYDLGEQFTYHHKAVAYFRTIAETSPGVIIKEYGRTNEGRPLIACFISSEENIKLLENIRRNHLINLGLIKGEKTITKDIPFIWLSYNVHGNESVGMEASMKVLHYLVSSEDKKVKDWLRKSVIVIDPCQNPDGRELYTTRYRRRQTALVNPDPSDWSHSQPWPSARLNHYLFDLNRDWAWQTQTETRQRISLYNSYMPHVHADFHEMGTESSYFFAPGAEPWHSVISDWQHEFHNITGKANARLFDQASRLYFTKENFDLFCPSFGDTWPLFNGAMGFTYEQGGGGRAGLSIKRETGDTLTLVKRIEGHFMSSLATIEAAVNNSEQLVKELNNYFKQAAENPGFKYKSIIVKNDNNRSDLIDFCDLLDKNQILYSYPEKTGKSYKGFDYLANKESSTTIEEGDLLISAYQPQSHLLEVLFEPDSRYSDSLSYDLTGWALPYLFNLKAYAIKEKINPANEEVSFVVPENIMNTERPYAYIADWEGFGEAKLAAALYASKVNIRYAAKPFTINGKTYNRGSLIIARGDNTHLGNDCFDSIIISSANNTRTQINTVNTGFVEKGIDLGSGYSVLNKPPSIAIIGGEETSQGSFGELWYFFEKELNYPVSIIDSKGLNRARLSDYDVIFVPSGNYKNIIENLMSFVKDGGRLILFEQAISIFATDKNTSLYAAVEKKKKEKEAESTKKKSDDPSLLKKYADQRRNMLVNRSASSIYRVKLDNTHPYAFGLGNEWFIIKRTKGYPYLEKGFNIAWIEEQAPVSGYAGPGFIKDVANTLLIGSEKVGSGELVYVTDDPYYRAFWKSGRVILSNLAFR